MVDYGKEAGSCSSYFNIDSEDLMILADTVSYIIKHKPTKLSSNTDELLTLYKAITESASLLLKIENSIGECNAV